MAASTSAAAAAAATSASDKACRFTITPQAYRKDGPWPVAVVGKGSDSRHWSLAASGQWCDFAVTCDSDPAFYRRFAGRVETGRHTVSDPAMGVSGDTLG